MSLKIKLGKAEHDALEEPLKSLYVADGENFKLDADYEDVTGLKAKRDELLRDLKDLQKKFDGIDPEAAKAAMTELETARREKMTADELHAEDIKKLTKDLETAKERSKALFKTQAERDLHLALANNKVRADKIEDAAIVLRAKHLKAVEEDGNPVWKSQSGETVNLNEFLTGLRSTKGDWFEPSTQPGGGASGSGNNGGSSATWTREQWDTADTTQRSEFSRNGGQIA
jgi:hypothetical protein